LEQLREKMVGEEIFLKKRKVVHLCMRKLCIKTAGLGSHDREKQFPNQLCQVNIMIAAQ